MYPNYEELFYNEDLFGQQFQSFPYYDAGYDERLIGPIFPSPGGQMGPPRPPGPQPGPPFGPPGPQPRPPGPPFGPPGPPPRPPGPQPGPPPFGPPWPPPRPPGPQPGPPFGPPPGPHHGPDAGPPTAPPPAYVPQMQQAGVFAVDPGSIRGCLYRYTYIWLRGRQQFWYYPTFIGRRSISGYRWNGFMWVYFGVSLRQIQSFQCV